VDLNFDAVLDDQEVNPGGFVCVNDDDDNDNNMPDKDETTPTLGENDLVPLTIALSGGWTGQGTVTLSCEAGCNRVRLYEEMDRSKTGSPSMLGPVNLPVCWSATQGGCRPWSELPRTLYVEGLLPSMALRDVELKALYTGQNGPCEDHLKLTVIQVDLDVDSDNNNAMADFGPQRTQGEEDIEDKNNLPGRIVWVNNNDDDRDNVADFGDGYNLNGANPNDDANTDEKNFVRIVFEVPPTVDLTKAKVRMTYDASNPAAATTITTPPNIAQAPGELRIWKKNGNLVRNPSVIPTGDYVAPGTYDPSALGLSNAMRTVNLWLEGIRPSSMIGEESILFEVDPDGPMGPAGFCGDAVRVTVSQLEILAWDASSTSMALADHVNVGHWGDDRGTNELNGYTAGLSGTALNGAGGTFIDVDLDRFMVRLTHLPGNASATVAELITVQTGTLTGTGTVDDADHNVTLLETGVNTGVFESEAHLMTAPNLSMVAATDQDDGFAVRSTRTGATVADEGDNDRTHKATIDGHVRVNYSAPSGPIDQRVSVCDRVPTDERKEIRVRVHVFNEPFDDFGLDGMPGTSDSGEGNGIYEMGEPFADISGDGVRNTVLGSTSAASTRVSEEIERSNVAWTQACIRVLQVGSTAFDDAPTNAAGANIIRDGLFNDGPGADEEVVILSTTGASHDVVEVFFISPFDPTTMAEGLASTPGLRGGIVLPAAMQENTYLFVASSANVRRRVLAHELGHALTNQGDVTTPVYVFFRSLDGSTHDDTVNRQRRITHQTQMDARTCRTAGSLSATGNRLLSGCP